MLNPKVGAMPGIPFLNLLEKDLKIQRLIKILDQACMIHFRNSGEVHEFLYLISI